MKNNDAITPKYFGVTIPEQVFDVPFFRFDKDVVSINWHLKELLGGMDGGLMVSSAEWGNEPPFLVCYPHPNSSATIGNNSNNYLFQVMLDKKAFDSLLGLAKQAFPTLTAETSYPFYLTTGNHEAIATLRGIVYRLQLVTDLPDPVDVADMLLPIPPPNPLLPPNP